MTAPAARIARVARWVRAWRVELAVAAAVTIGRALLATVTGFAAADALFVAAGIGLVAHRPARRWAAGLLVASRAHRGWETALAGVWPPPATPQVIAAGIQPYGPWVTVRVAAGTTVDDLAKRAAHLAAWMAVQTVRVIPHPHNAALAAIQALTVDPLAGPPTPWPWAEVDRTDLWQPVPVAVDDRGEEVSVELAGHNLLIGGEPGAGKSVALSQLVAAAALDPHSCLFLLDGKLVELAAWKLASNGFAGTDIGQATELLVYIQQGMDARYRWMADTGRRKIDPGTTLAVVVIDELAHYLAWPDKKPRDAFTDTLRDLVSRGRAAGVVVIAATQKPSTDIVPSSLRDLFGYRWALRCTTPAASDTILGAGWATNGHTASTIPPALRGGGYLLHESGLPIRCRAHHLTDTDIDTIARRAAQLRADRRAIPRDDPDGPSEAPDDPSDAPEDQGDNGEAPATGGVP